MSKKHFNQSSIMDDEFGSSYKQHNKNGRNRGGRDTRRQADPMVNDTTTLNLDPQAYKPKNSSAADESACEAEGSSSFIDMISTLMLGQMTNYVNSQAGLEEKTVNERKSIEASLFRIAWPMTAQTPEEGILQLYTIDRSVRIDRDTHKLNRASCTIVAIGSEGTPVYTITAYLTNRFTGTVSVIPIGTDGPVYRESKRFNFNMSEPQE